VGERSVERLPLRRPCADHRRASLQSEWVRAGPHNRFPTQARSGRETQRAGQAVTHVGQPGRCRRSGSVCGPTGEGARTAGPPGKRRTRTPCCRHPQDRRPQDRRSWGSNPTTHRAALQSTGLRPLALRFRQQAGWTASPQSGLVQAWTAHLVVGRPCLGWHWLPGLVHATAAPALPALLAVCVSKEVQQCSYRCYPSQRVALAPKLPRGELGRDGWQAASPTC